MKKLLRRPSPSMAVAVLALLVALGGTSYAAVTLPANSVGTKQIKKGAVTLPKIAASARASLRGQRGPAGKPCAPTNPACRGPAGPGAVGMFVDSSQPFSNKTLGQIGPWTIKADCLNESGATHLGVSAEGPSDTVADGLLDGAADSNNGGSIFLAPVLVMSSGFGYHVVELNLHSAQGSAHIFAFIYAQSPSSFRCKVNAVGYAAS